MLRDVDLLARSSPISPSMRVNSCPAAPTNGSPCLSSWKPGPSPMNIRSASGSPTPKTTCVRLWASRHFVQPDASAAAWRACGSRVASPLRGGAPSWPSAGACSRHRTLRERADLAIELDRTLHHRDVPGVLPARTKRRVGQRRRQGSRPLAGGVTRSCSPTTTSGGRGCGAAHSAGRSPSAPASPSVHTSDGRPLGQVHDVLDHVAGSVGAELGEPHAAPRRSAGLASTALRRRSTRSAASGASQPRTERESVTDPIAATNQVGRGGADEDDAGDRGREQSGVDLGDRDRGHRAHAVPHDHRAAGPGPPPRAPRRCRAPSIAATGRRRAGCSLAPCPR